MQKSKISNLIIHNMGLVIKSVKFWTILLLLHSIFTFLLYTFFKEVSINYTAVTIQLIFGSLALLFSMAAASFFLSNMLQDLIIIEKQSKRLEYLLATGVTIKTLWLGIGFSMSLLVTGIIFSLTANFFIYMFLVGQNPLVILGLGFTLLIIFILPLLFTLFSILLTGLGLVIRNSDIMTTMIYFSGIFLISGGTYVVSQYLMKATHNRDLFLSGIVFFFIITSIILVLANYIISKIISTEKVVLTIPR